MFISNPPGFFLNPRFFATIGFETAWGSKFSPETTSTGAFALTYSSLIDRLGFLIYYCFNGAAKTLLLLLFLALPQLTFELQFSSSSDMQVSKVRYSEIAISGIFIFFLIIFFGRVNAIPSLF